MEQETIETSSDRIGLVFPVFAWGLPRIVSDFVNKLTVSKKQYIFAVATCVAIPGNTLKKLKKALRQKGADLNAGFTVRANRSSLMNRNKLDKIITRLDSKRKKIKNGETRLAEIVSAVNNFKQQKIETSSWSASIFGSIIHDLALKSFKSIDHTFEINNSCNGCGICAKVCPRSNIVIEENRPVFMHNCELCHACIQWCPSFAIKHPNFDGSLKQYHNPAIKAIDLFTR